jgi:hypothetical protein
MEMGKDILAIDPDGVPCAYQLKGIGGSKMSIGEWRRELSQQIGPLVNERIVHPSIPQDCHHRSFIVVNGELEEEVHRAIDDFNQTNARSGFPERKVETILKGQLFQFFKDLQSDFWATNLHDLKTYLEMLTEDGRGQLPKAKLCKLFKSALPFELKTDKKSRKTRPSADECVRAISGCSIICASAISPFTNQENHLAEFEAWTLLRSYTLALAEKWNLPQSKVRFAVELAEDAMYTALGRLCDEMMGRDHYVEGTNLAYVADAFVYRVRITQLLGLLGIYGLWRQQRVKAGQEEVDEKRDDFLRKFCMEKADLICLWGEYAIPQVLACYFFSRAFHSTQESDFRYLRLLHIIARKNQPGQKDALANPYYDAEAILPYVLGLERKPLRDSFAGSSYFLEGLLHLAVRTNYKEAIKSIFPDVTRVGLKSYVPEEPWQFYLFDNVRRGTSHQRMLPLPQSWPNLRALAEESEGKEIPRLLKQFPILYLCFLCVLPHRANASGLRWLSTQLDGSTA